MSEDHLCDSDAQAEPHDVGDHHGEEAEEADDVASRKLIATWTQRPPRRHGVGQNLNIL